MSEAGSPRTLGRHSGASISAPLIRLAALLLGVALTLSPLLVTPARAIGANDIYVGSSDDSSGASSCDDPDFSTNGDDEGHINLALDAALAAVDDDGDVIIVCNGLYEYDDSTLVHDADESRYDSITIHAETSGGVILTPRRGSRSTSSEPHLQVPSGGAAAPNSRPNGLARSCAKPASTRMDLYDSVVGLFVGARRGGCNTYLRRLL